VVIQQYPFYLKTHALEIDHGDFIVRYGEISNVASGIIKGAKVKRGQVIAYVGELVFPSGNKMSMLHIEFYKGTSKGPLTVRGATPYHRRVDLINPTSYLDTATIK
jgi:murein DD-endopeptidase MepM/ murein hydrolase activator NlpD